MDETFEASAPEVGDFDAVLGLPLQTPSEVAVNEAPWMEGKKKREAETLVEITPAVSLLLKLDAWLLQQPEFILLLQAPRPVRRQAVRLIAKHITTFPTRGKPFGGFAP